MGNAIPFPKRTAQQPRPESQKEARAGEAYDKDVKWAAAYLGYSTTFPVYQMVAKNRIPHYRLPSGVIRFKQSELDTWLKRQPRKSRPHRRQNGNL
jgi:excisionase family DNA binding protein